MIKIHRVKCKYCGISFDRDKIPFKQISSNRYAHLECAENIEKAKTKEEIDKEELEEYIKKLFNIDTIQPKVKKQIITYIKEYNFTYSGIHKALVYFYEIKKNDISKSNGGIGIVPYCYQQAYEYYYSLWQAQQINQDKDISQYIPKETKIKIPIPQRRVRKKRRFFSFLDNDEV